VKVKFILKNELSSSIYTIELYLTAVDDPSASHFLLIKLLIITFIISFNYYIIVHNLSTTYHLHKYVFHYIQYASSFPVITSPHQIFDNRHNQTLTGLIMTISSTTNSSSDFPSVVGRLPRACFPVAIRLGASRASMASSG
jgi:hypothetical protein